MRLSRLAALLVLVAFSLPLLPTAQAEVREISARRAKERKTFSDAEIANGFFKVAFGAEMGFGGPVDRIRKYVKPVRIFVENNAKPDRTEEVAKVVADIQARIANIDIAITERRENANFIVRLVRDRDLAKTVMKLYGPRGRKIVRSLEPQCLSGFRKDDLFRITNSDVILVSDAGDFIFYDCAYEELLQALGPIRDDSSVPWTMFNDNVQMGFFGVYDQYILNILYHQRVEPGMTRAQVRALLPQIMPEIREHVARINNVSPKPPIGR
ncbi:hypothetical protein GJW-30_1_01714 [Variibacter gotjawalensis]|uniref:DUF2927 domain-containing protein n=1 Tax=Variibacter gotjawalensis TaxID=1333996 RepID=A0A0S3PTA8_9BRAD|nr:DUF2927 domain-containing protein [Variibacter gotjawalensis]NIK49498.1 hypothetical protein [Variibacter gotjawalensis]RZS51350.1 DUF2927 family protein [Variibacter gotjawalensis]BAT59183.1 hypothetical protein GJW-30_1_01714 [Variibacter gotjawalensis]